MFRDVLGLDGTGLIFTRSQEGTQKGRLTQTGQTDWSIRYHVPLCSVLSGGAGQGEVNSGSGARWSSGGESCSVHFAVWYIPLISIVVVTLCFVCCSVKLPSS